MNPLDGTSRQNGVAHAEDRREPGALIGEIVEASTTEFLAVADSWTVSELSSTVTGFEAIIGPDLLAQLLLVLNGPRNEFALAG